MFEFKTIVVCAEGSNTANRLNELYSEGWQFVDATAPNSNNDEYISHLYFTLKRGINRNNNITG